jgi:hypothetical protein
MTWLRGQLPNDRLYVRLEVWRVETRARAARGCINAAVRLRATVRTALVVAHRRFAARGKRTDESEAGPDGHQVDEGTQLWREAT